jgi:superfamily I DNA and RNA helicase
MTEKKSAICASVCQCGDPDCKQTAVWIKDHILEEIIREGGSEAEECWAMVQLDPKMVFALIDFLSESLTARGITRENA